MGIGRSNSYELAKDGEFPRSRPAHRAPLPRADSLDPGPAGNRPLIRANSSMEGPVSAGAADRSWLTSSSPAG